MGSSNKTSSLTNWKQKPDYILALKFQCDKYRDDVLNVQKHIYLCSNNVISTGVMVLRVQKHVYHFSNYVISTGVMC